MVKNVKILPLPEYASRPPFVITVLVAAAA